MQADDTLTATVEGGPTGDGGVVEFRLADPDGRYAAVRLAQEVRVPGDRLELARRDGPGSDWVLALPRPAVNRIEYQFEVALPDGRREWLCDPANPVRSPGAFGEKSVLELPGYRPPGWLREVAPDGSSETLDVPARALGRDVRVTLWSPAGVRPDRALPLLVVHDGPEFAALASLTTYLATGAHTGRLPAVRAALLDPGDRDEWYAANGSYTQALALAVLPRLREAVATSATVGMGASLGALAMLHAQRRHPEAFDGLFLQSGSFFHPRHDEHERRFSRYEPVVRFVQDVLRSGAYRSPVPTVMTCGAIEENLANNRIMARSLAAQGYDVALHEVPDVHNYVAWRDALHPYLTGLLGLVG